MSTPRPASRIIGSIRRHRFRDAVFCPHCRNRHVHRWGQSGGRRRYRCVACRRTFNDLTGTPLAYLKHAELWNAFCSCMAEQLTVRRVAARLGVHRDTALRWRHRLLEALRREDPTRLGGEIGLTDWPLLRSRILLARDEAGRTAAGLLEGRHPTAEDVAATLEARLLPGSTLNDGRGWYGAVARFVDGWPTEDGAPPWAATASARRRGRENRPLDRRSRKFRGRPGIRYRPGAAARTHGVRAFAARLRRWIRRFHGVARRYMDNYLGWRRFVEATEGLDAARIEERLLNWSFP